MFGEGKFYAPPVCNDSQGTWNLSAGRENLAAAARNSRIEGLFTGGFTGGLKGRMDPYDIADAAETTADPVKPHNKSLKKCACE